MNLIQNFDIETIASFELTVFGQETYLCMNKCMFLFIPFHRIGHYDEKKGLTHTYNLGYIIVEGIMEYNVRIAEYKDDMRNTENHTSYKLIFNQFKCNNEISLADVGLRTTGLVWFSIGIVYRSLHIAYDFISQDCAPTIYSQVLEDGKTTDFLLNHHLLELHDLIRITKKWNNH